MIQLWLLAGAVMVVALGVPPVRRTQEARVLVTAREMLERSSREGLRAWLVPHMNVQVRLEKPPLAYWLAAASMKMFGVNEPAGRLPTVLAGWLTLAFVYRIGRRVFTERAGFFAAAALLGSYLFFRHARLAETDVLATLFVTAAVHWLWCAADVDGANLRALRLPLSFVAFSHLAAVMTALAILAKGPPAAFVALFFIALAAATRRWHVLWRWLFTGAPLTLALIAAPWFWYIYLRMLPQSPVLREELRKILEGDAHPAPFYLYFPQLLLAVAPWCAIVVVAIIAAAMRTGENPRVRVLLAWAACVFAALCLAQQRQLHYLIAVLPALALIVGWWIDAALQTSQQRAVSRDRDDASLLRTLVLLTVAVIALASIAAPFIARQLRGEFRGDDFFLAVAGVLSALLVVAFYGSRDRARGATAFAIVVPLLISGMSMWASTLDASSARTIAAVLRERYDGSPMCFYGDNASLPLVWEMRRVMPQYKTADELIAAAARSPNLIAIGQTKHNLSPPPMPAGFVQDFELKSADQVYRTYLHRAGP